MPAVEVHDLTVAYRTQPVLWDVDLGFRKASSSPSSAPTAPARAR